MPEPTDPITSLAEGAAQLHEVYLAYLHAGFNEQQALALTKAVLVTSLGAGS